MSISNLILIPGPEVGKVQPVQTKMGEFRIDFFALESGRSAGVWCLKVTAADWSSTWLPTRGMSLAEVRTGPRRFGWNSPVQGPVHPNWVPISEPSGLGWLEGFDELLVRCGLSSNGAPQHNAAGQLEFPLHGRIANLPASQLILSLNSEGELVIESLVEEVRFHFAKWNLRSRVTLSGSSMKMSIEDTIQNRGGRPQDFQLLYHFNLGAPLLGPGARVHAPLQHLVPRNTHSAKRRAEWAQITAPEAGFAEDVFFARPVGDASGRSLAVLVDAAGECAAAIRFDTKSLPCLTFWKNLADERDGYVVGLEPGTNFPNTRNYEAAQGRTVWLDPDQETTLNLELQFSTASPLTRDWVQQVEAMQATTEMVIYEESQPGWCEE